MPTNFPVEGIVLTHGLEPHGINSPQKLAGFNLKGQYIDRNNQPIQQMTSKKILITEKNCKELIFVPIDTTKDPGALKMEMLGSKEFANIEKAHETLPFDKEDLSKIKR